MDKSGFEDRDNRSTNWNLIYLLVAVNTIAVYLFLWFFPRFFS